MNYFAIAIIKTDDKFGHVIWDNNQIVPQVDLYKIHHFDNKAKQTSLKILEFNMREDSIMDLPYQPGTMLTSEQIDHLIIYNFHDVEKTEKFFIKSAEQIKFREYLSEKYNRNFLNHNDTKIGKDYLIMELGEDLCYHKVDGKRQPQQTHRKEIRFRDIIFPYVQFQHPEFNRVLKWLQDTTINGYDTKDCIKVWSSWAKGQGFSGEWHDERDVFTGGPWVVKSKPLSCTIEGFQFDFGTGGIHGSLTNAIIESDEQHCILDLDVTSYYPSLGIVNRLHPQHLGEKFCDVYADIKKQRLTYGKTTPENAMLKLALNGTYGDTNNIYSPFYDPQYTMSITINGQLLLCMLAEQMMLIPGLQMIQVNTDGVTVKVDRRFLPHIEEVKKWWCAVTDLELEEAFYSRFFIRDVNNYIAEGEDGKLKRKGAYEYSVKKPGAKGNLGWHQNHSALIIQIAAEAFLLHSTPIEQTVKNHPDIMDFMLRTKVPRSSRLVMEWDNGRIEQIQNVTRYFISTDGGNLIKIMPPLSGKGGERRIGINVGWKATECNRLPAHGPIDYRFYVQEAIKLTANLRTYCNS